MEPKSLSPDALPGSKYAKNAFAAGATPWTPPGELTALSQITLAGFGGRFAAGGEYGLAEKGREERRGRGRMAGEGRAPETAYSR